MDEATWLSSADPVAMLRHLTHKRVHAAGAGTTEIPREYSVATARKLRLFCCACNRLFHRDSYLDSGCTSVEEADGERDDWIYGPSVEEFHRDSYLDSGCTAGLAQIWCERAGIARGAGDPQTRENTAALLREIFGNPYRPGYRWTDQPRAWTSNLTGAGRAGPTYAYLPRSWLTWQDGIVSRLAESAYRERTADGFLDPVRLAILADALEESGCQEEEILRHLRGWRQCSCRPRDGMDPCPECGGRGVRYGYANIQPCPDCGSETASGMCSDCGGTGWVRSKAPHVRGCFVLDTFLGKE